MRNPIIKPVLAAALALGIGACATGFGGAGRSMADQYEDQPVSVTVENHNWSDVVVYLVRSGMRNRLGSVMSMSEATFEVPRAVLPTGGDVRLLIDPIGSRVTHLTDPINVAPGQIVRMNVENNLRLTNWSVW